MIYNNNITSEYGVSSPFSGNFPVSYQPIPNKEDYVSGFFVRWFARRANEFKSTEIDPVTSGQINTDLYKIVSVTWKISGPKDTLIVNGIIEKSGVKKENEREIERVKRETEVDLRTTLTNPLELWRGY